MRELDANHWLYRLAPRAWLSAALTELSRAEGALANHDRRGGLAACRRAAGMALNGALATASEPDGRYGRSYMDHLMFLRSDATAGEPGLPDEVRIAARMLVETPLPAGGASLVALRTAGGDERLLEATRTVMAHALAIVLKGEPGPVNSETPGSAAGRGGAEPPAGCAKSDPPEEAQ